MNGAQINTDFSGLAASGLPASYPAVTSPDEATKVGDYEKANQPLKKPFRLERWRMPDIKLPFTRK